GVARLGDDGLADIAVGHAPFAGVTLVPDGVLEGLARGSFVGLHPRLVGAVEAVHGRSRVGEGGGLEPLPNVQANDVRVEAVGQVERDLEAHRAAPAGVAVHQNRLVAHVLLPLTRSLQWSAMCREAKSPHSGGVAAAARPAMLGSNKRWFI